MPSLLEWVLVGVVLYTVVGLTLKARGMLPEYVKLSGPITTLHTQRGRAFLTWLARPKRFWRAWGNFGVGLALVVMVGSFLVVVFSALSAIQQPEQTAITQPRNVLVIPGVNQFLPLSVAPAIIAGLALGLIVHEGGHGLLCRVEDIDIESLGLASFAFIPIGAFVAPDEESIMWADRGAQVRMFAAGVTNNFALGLLCLLLLFGPVIGSFAVVSGVPVGDSLPGSPAARAGIDSGDVITSVDGQPIANESDLVQTLRDRGATVQVGLQDGRTVTVERAPVVTIAVPDAPVSVNETITHVNGTRVGTSGEFYAAALNRTVAAITTADGETSVGPIGAYGRVAPDGPLAAAGAPAEAGVFVTSIDGQRTPAGQFLLARLDDRSPGERATVVAYVDGERQVYNVTLGGGPETGGQIGLVATQLGVSGFRLDDFGVDRYPAATFLELLGGDADRPSGLTGLSLAQWMLAFVVLPFGAVVLPFQYGFAGFTGIATNFYEVNGWLGALGDGPAFVLANVLFWTGWINILIGQFNLFPTYPLDGGHILRASVESVVARLPIEGRQRVTTTVTIAVSLFIIAGLLTMVFAPNLLS